MGQTIALLAIVASCSALEGFNESRRDPWLGVDKAEHFGCGLAIATIADVGIGVVRPTMGPWRRRTIAFASAVLAGTLKEVYDSRHPGRHDASCKDATWTYGGGAVGVVAAEWTIRW